MYRYKGHWVDSSTRAYKVHKLGGGMRAHKVHKVCWQVGATTGTGALWQYPVSSWGVA